MEKMVLVGKNGNYYGTVIDYIKGKFRVLDEQSGESETIDIHTVKKMQLKVIISE